MLRIWRDRTKAPVPAPPSSQFTTKPSGSDGAPRSVRNDTSGALRRLRQTVADNTLL